LFSNTLSQIKQRFSPANIPTLFGQRPPENRLIEKVTESLAGRAAILKLLPLTLREATGMPQALLPWEEKKQQGRRKNISSPDLWKRFLRGGYPELTANPDRDVVLWHASYVQTYLERDVRSLRQIGDIRLPLGPDAIALPFMEL
jgi:predicted AAA+ superfamily ATPase